MPLVVLHILGCLNRGGIPSWLMGLVRMREPDLQFDFAVTHSGVLDEEIRKLGCGTHFLPRNPFFASAALGKLMVAGDYQVIHCHGMEFAGDALRLARRFGVPVRIAHAHNTCFCRGRRGLLMALRRLRFCLVGRPRLLRHATAVLACSHAAGEFFLGKTWGGTCCRVLQYGVPLENFRLERSQLARAKLCERFGVPPGSTVVGHVGNLTTQKNQFFLLRVLSGLISENANTVLFLAGEGPLRQQLEQAVLRQGLRSAVFMPGCCDNVPELMTQLFDAFLLPSRYEGLPIAMLEATAAGLHSVCSEAIPSECADALSPHVTRLSLSTPVQFWCDAVKKAVRLRTAPSQGEELLRKNNFEASASLHGLLKVYRAVNCDYERANICK